MRPVINEARPAVQLAWPYQEVNIAPSLATRSMFGRWVPECSAAARVTTEVIPADVVHHYHDDVGRLGLRLRLVRAHKGERSRYRYAPSKGSNCGRMTEFSS